jgi:biopolymer transport protein ExbD
MGMNVGPSARSDEPEIMMDINTTPLIDVMLVLLVMLIITIPIQLHAVNMDLPVGKPPENIVKPEKIQIDIDDKSTVYWQGLPVTGAELEANMNTIAQQGVQPEVHIRPHKDSEYAVFASVLAASKRKGLTKMAVIGSEQFVQ